MHTWCEISGDALRSNYESLRGVLGPVPLAPVLKSNAYGHGLRETYRALEPLKPLILCVNYAFEAKLLREEGFRGRLILIGPSFEEDLAKAFHLKVEVVLGGDSLLEAWLNTDSKCYVHLKFDTGLSRQGLSVEGAPEYASKMKPFASYLKGISMHFANVEDVTGQEYAEVQLRAFFQVDKSFYAFFGETYERHASASAPSLLLEKARFDFCRIGISLYGFWPSSLTKLSFLSQHKRLPVLEAALSWKTKIASVRTIKPGTFIGYGCSYQANDFMKIAVLPVGYYEGFPRSLSNSGAYVLCHGKRCSLLGRVCMNMIIIDLTSCPEALVGEEVILIGKSGANKITAEDLAEWAGTIQYEIVTCLHENLSRKLIS